MKVGDLIYNRTHDIKGLLVEYYGSQCSGTVQCWWVLYTGGVMDIVDDTDIEVISEGR